MPGKENSYPSGPLKLPRVPPVIAAMKMKMWQFLLLAPAFGFGVLYVGVKVIKLAWGDGP